MTRTQHSRTGYSFDDIGYRVGWAENIKVEILSESDEENGETRELWTHNFHSEREPAPYAESEIAGDNIPK